MIRASVVGDREQKGRHMDGWSDKQGETSITHFNFIEV